MKKSFLLAAGFSFLLIACDHDEKSEKNEKQGRAAMNLESMHKVNQAFATGDVSAIDSVVDASFVDHFPDGDKNRDSLKMMIPKMKEADPSMKMEVIQEMTNDDYVAGWYHWTGNGNGTMGMPMGPYDFRALELVKFNESGKAIEHWAFMEVRDAMKMMNEGNGAKKDGK